MLPVRLLYWFGDCERTMLETKQFACKRFYKQKNPAEIDRVFPSCDQPCSRNKASTKGVVGDVLEPGVGVLLLTCTHVGIEVLGGQTAGAFDLDDLAVLEVVDHGD
jgi:hypothetical protein